MSRKVISKVEGKPGRGLVESGEVRGAANDVLTGLKVCGLCCSFALGESGGEFIIITDMTTLDTIIEPTMCKFSNELFVRSILPGEGHFIDVAVMRSGTPGCHLFHSIVLATGWGGGIGCHTDARNVVVCDISDAEEEGNLQVEK